MTNISVALESLRQQLIHKEYIDTLSRSGAEYNKRSEKRRWDTVSHIGAALSTVCIAKRASRVVSVEGDVRIEEIRRLNHTAVTSIRRCGHGPLRPLASKSSSELKILGLYGDSLGVDSGKVGWRGDRHQQSFIHDVGLTHCLRRGRLGKPRKPPGAQRRRKTGCRRR